MGTAGAGECEVDGRRWEVWRSGAQAGREQGVVRWQDAGGWSIGAQVREYGADAGRRGSRLRARSRSRSDNTLCCHSLRSRHFVVSPPTGDGGNGGTGGDGGLGGAGTRRWVGKK